VPSKVVAVLAAFALASPVLASAGDKDNESKGKKPGIELRASPRYAFSPASILFTAELKGGDDVEELYCPAVEWEWGDGGKSEQESDCDPWAPGMTIQRRYTANHTYPFAGIYRVRITLLRSGRQITTQSLRITIRAGLGDPNPDPGF
jgi:hypothetical protein